MGRMSDCSNGICAGTKETRMLTDGLFAFMQRCSHLAKSRLCREVQCTDCLTCIELSRTFSVTDGQS